MAGIGAGFGELEIGPVTDDKGSWVITKNSLCLTVFQIEEERSTRAQLPQRVMVDGRDVSLPPPLGINLVVLVSAHFEQYTEGLRLLAELRAVGDAPPPAGVAADGRELARPIVGAAPRYRLRPETVARLAEVTGRPLGEDVDAQVCAVLDRLKA